MIAMATPAWAAAAAIDSEADELGDLIGELHRATAATIALDAVTAILAAREAGASPFTQYLLFAKAVTDARTAALEAAEIAGMVDTILGHAMSGIGGGGGGDRDGPPGGGGGGRLITPETVEEVISAAQKIIDGIGALVVGKQTELVTTALQRLLPHMSREFQQATAAILNSEATIGELQDFARQAEFLYGEVADAAEASAAARIAADERANLARIAAEEEWQEKWFTFLQKRAQAEVDAARAVEAEKKRIHNEALGIIRRSGFLSGFIRIGQEDRVRQEQKMIDRILGRGGGTTVNVNLQVEGSIVSEGDVADVVTEIVNVGMARGSI